jgi:hypothetical protein
LFRKCSGLGLAVVILIASLVTLGTPAQAGEYDPAGHPNCPHGANYVSSACLLQPSPHWGIYGEIQNIPMTMSDNAHSYQAHINHTLWTYGGDPCVAFIEAGLTKGYRDRPQNQNYGYYWGYRQAGEPDSVDFFVNTAPVDNLHRRYWLRYNGAGEYSALIDFGGGFTHLGRIGNIGGGSCRSQAGLEEVKITVGGFPQIPGPDFSSATNNIINLKYQTTTYPAGANYETFLSGNTLSWSGQWKWIDYPCGQGNFPPYCLNGLHQSDIWWQANHPSQ